MTEEKTTGLLLQSIPYLGQKRILKVLTADSGLLSFFTKGKLSPVLATPFVFAEWVFQKTQKELYPLTDATLLDDLSHLKKDYPSLLAAGQLANDLLRTQVPGGDAQGPLTLALACLRKLPLFKEPAILLAAFRLKLLALEGLIDDLPPPLQELLAAKSFAHLASLSKDEQVCREVDLLFEEKL